jgi:transcriptional regulator with XRE-family HTH domain
LLGSPSRKSAVTDESGAASRSVARKLRVLRERNGLTLQAVESLSEGRFKAATVGAWERGSRSPSVEKLAALAAFYGVSLHELLEP